MEKTLILTVGLPRSGKSTWALEQKFPIVNPDSIRIALHGNYFTPEAEPMVWTIARYMVSALFVAGHNIIIVDATHTTSKRREFWNFHKVKRMYKIFDIEKEICIQRAKEGKRGDLIPVIERMAENWDINDIPKEDIITWREVKND